MITSLIILSAVLLDAALGEPRRFHPLVGFGHLVVALEKRLNPKGHYLDKSQILLGALAISLLLVLIVLPLMWLDSLLNSPTFSFLFSVLVVYFCIAYRSLIEHVRAIKTALEADDLIAARFAVSMIVSRNTEYLSEQAIASAAIESALENTNDAVFGALFCFAVGGLPGILIYRIMNTLDAMWGYRTERFNYFGRVAAKLDDYLNYIPARLSALVFAMMGHTSNALACWRTQASSWKSSNAGVVMATGSGALQVQLGGSACYHGKMEFRPVLGRGKLPDKQDITATLDLLRGSLMLWLLLTVCCDGIVFYA